MNKNLIITHIPKTFEAISNTIALVEDHSWSTESMNEWLECDKCNSVYYSSTYGTYLFSTENLTPKNINRNHLTYNELIGGR